MNTFKKICCIYEQILRVNNPPIAPIEEPGLSHDEIAQLFKNIDLSPLSLLIEVYEWHNGIYCLEPFLNFLSLSDSIDLYHFYEKLDIDFLADSWKSCWFPILCMNGDVRVFIDMNDGSLISIDIELNRVERIAEHYDDYLDAMLEVFENKAFVYDDACGLIKTDETLWENMMQKYKIKKAW
jgi:hypothetical protein